ncbi:MAG: hypothetical protein HY420_00175 [Candidatus Kerfeldbacteria bacterium]|nr:hypothetical protein [Candidatus Kerfeldbacteria bacterium]
MNNLGEIRQEQTKKNSKSWTIRLGGNALLAFPLTVVLFIGFSVLEQRFGLGRGEGGVEGFLLPFVVSVLGFFANIILLGILTLLIRASTKITWWIAFTLNILYLLTMYIYYSTTL